MIEMAAIFGGSFTLALSGALMPGPLLTVTISESAQQGFKTGPLLMVGHAILELVLVVAVIQGLGAYLQLPLVMAIIFFLGGSLLIYLGIDMVRTSGSLSLETDAPGEGIPPKRSRNPVVMGVLTSLLNPYWILWWATIGLGYLVTVMKLGVLGIAVFFLGHIAADFAWYSLVSLGVSRGKTFLKDSGYRMLIRCCGIFLFFFGGWFLVCVKNYLV